MTERRTVIVACPCGTLMTRRPSELLITKQPVCSRKCLYKYRHQSPSGAPTDEWLAKGSRPRTEKLAEIPRTSEIEEKLFSGVPVGVD